MVVYVFCDKNNFVLCSDVAAGNVHDSVMFDGLYKKLIEKFPKVAIVALDGAYKTPWILNHPALKVQGVSGSGFKHLSWKQCEVRQTQTLKRQQVLKGITA